MACLIELLGISALWLALWALREYERRQRFTALDEEIGTLQASNRKLREENALLREQLQARLEENAVLRELEQSHLRVIGAVRDHAQEIRDRLDFGDVLLPASANGAVEGQRFETTVRVTGRLDSAPIFSGRAR